MNKLIISTTTIAMVALILNVGHGFALTSEQRSSVGFQDGLQDCGTGTSTMLNSASNAGHHTQAYMEGYYQGLNSCVKPVTNNNNQNSGNVDQNNRNQAISQGTSQHQGFCVTVFSGCSQTSGESAGLSN